jgi:hypothetical protein
VQKSSEKGIVVAAQRRLRDAWRKGGVILHSVVNLEEYVKQANESGMLVLDNDCGAMCSAWTFAKKKLPSVFYYTESIGFMIPVDSNFTTSYVKSMTPHDSGSISRQFCNTQSAGADGFSNVADLAQLYTLSSAYNSSIRTTPSGCAPDDEDCQIMVAGGGYQFASLLSSLSLLDIIATVAKADPAVAWIAMREFVLNAQRAPARSFEPSCEVGTPLPGLNGTAFNIKPSCKMCGKLDLCPSNMTGQVFYERYIKPAFLLYTAFNGAEIEGNQIAPSLLFDSLIMSCKFDARLPNHWQALADSYELFWEEVLQLVKNTGSVYDKTWNEVDAYAPPKGSDERKVADKVHDQSIVGMFITGTATDVENNMQIAEALAKLHRQANPSGPPLGIYHCKSPNPSKGKTLYQYMKSNIISKETCIFLKAF